MTNISKNAEMPQCDKTAVMHSNLSLADKIELEIAKIFFLANQINRKTEMCCFANDVAHCNYVEIKLHKTALKSNRENILDMLCFLCFKLQNISVRIQVV